MIKTYICKFCHAEFQLDNKYAGGIMGAHTRLCEANPNLLKNKESLKRGAINSNKSPNRKSTKHKVYEYTLICKKCGNRYTIKCTESQLKRGNYTHYCSSKCAHTRVISPEIKQKISNTLTKNKKEKHFCKECGKELGNKNSTGYCRLHCSKFKVLNLFPETREKFRNAGKKSASIQRELRRSKNEMLFCKMCEEHFTNVKHNENIFNGWDADVILEDYKIAILWNGKFHYENIFGQLKQIQNRDRIKINEITKCNYIPYIIKDMGKYNEKFVKQEFDKFVNWINNLRV